MNQVTRWGEKHDKPVGQISRVGLFKNGSPNAGAENTQAHCLNRKQCFGSGSGWIRIQFGPGSGFGIRIQVSKNRFKKPKFTYYDRL
jgi:hypothetical protein